LRDFFNSSITQSPITNHPITQSPNRLGGEKVIREQLVNQKNQGRNKGGSAKGARVPAKQKSRTKSDWQDLMAEFQEIRAYLVIGGLVFAFVLSLALLFIGYRVATGSAFFALKEIKVSGAVRTSQDDIKTLTRRVVGKKGVWNTDLTTVRNEVEKLPWVRFAFVSRVLPDGIRVRVIEREAHAVVRLSKDKAVLVDEEANILSAAGQNDKPAPFILRGWDEANTDSAKEDNRERVDLYRELADELSVFGIASRVREINLGDVNHVIANVTFSDSVIDIRLGDKDFGNRLKYAIERTEVERSETDWRCISYVDITQGVDKGNRLAFGPKEDCSATTDEQIANEEINETEDATNKEQPVVNKTEKRKTESNTTTKKSESKKETTSKEKKKTETTKSSTQNKTTASNKSSKGSTNKTKTEQHSDNTSVNKKSGEKKTNQSSQTSDKNNKKSSSSKTEVRPRKV